MGIFTTGRRVQPRRFSYEPRYYKPEKDENLKRRMRIHSAARSKRRSSSMIQLAVILVIVVYLYTVLT